MRSPASTTTAWSTGPRRRTRSRVRRSPNFVDEELGGAEGKTVNIGARNDAYGTGLAETFSAAWEELGGTVGEEVIYDTELPNYDTEAEPDHVRATRTGS